MLTCVEWFVWLGSGVVVVPLLQWLKKLPRVGAYVDRLAWLAAPLLSAILPQLASALTPYCAKIDPLGWAAILTGMTYLVSQIVYWVSKETGRVA
jgi:hypothetical protein